MKCSEILLSISVMLIGCQSLLAAPLQPTPQKITIEKNRVSISKDCAVYEKSDSRNVKRALLEFLGGSGIRGVELMNDTTKLPAANTLFILGEKAATDWDHNLSSIIKSLPDEGYVLRIKTEKGHTVILLAGNTENGSFYALQTLKELFEDRNNLHEQEIVDYPDFKARGIVEGFYGTPWTHENRLSMIRFMGLHKLNTYIYAPKDDPYHREKWREPYPPLQLSQLKELINTSKENFVQFTFAISPGVSIRYSSDEDFDALCRKVDQMQVYGVNNFALLLDDIGRDFNYPEDASRFSSIAQAQAFLINRLYEHLRIFNSKATLIACPTYYYIAEPNDYVKTLGTLTNPEVSLMWTGNGVTDANMRVSDADLFASGIRRKPYVWDNYPVNDYARDRLLLGPVRNRVPELAEHLSGLVSNPMNQAEASKIVLGTYADYLWNPKSYNPDKSWGISLQRQGGRSGYPYLKLFAEQTQSSFLFREEAPQLNREIDEYLKDKSPKNEETLKKTFKQFIDLREKLPKNIANQQMVPEIKPFVEKLSRYGEAGLTFLSTVQPTEGNSIVSIWNQIASQADLLSKVNEIPQKIGGGVPEKLLAKYSSVAFSKELPFYRACSSLSPFQQNTLDKMLDKKEDTFFWSNRPVEKDDFMQVELGKTRNIDKVTIHMGSNDRPTDWIHKGLLQYTEDGKNWKTLIPIDKPDISWKGAPLSMQAVRILAIDSQAEWTIIKEFDVHSSGQPIISSNINAASGSELESIVDNCLESEFTTVQPPKKGGWIQLDFGKDAHNFHEMTILFDRLNSLQDGQVLISQNGKDWELIGSWKASDSSKGPNRAAKAFVLPKSKSARFIKLEVTEDQSNPAGIHEFLWK